MFGNLFKTRGSGVKFSKKGQYTKRKYIREKRFTKDAKAKRKAAAGGAFNITGSIRFFIFAPVLIGAIGCAGTIAGTIAGGGAGVLFFPLFL